MQVWYESHDLARWFSMMQPPSKCTTPAAIRARVRMGYATPQAYTARGGALWTWDGMLQEVSVERRLQLDAIRLGIKDANTSVLLQRRANREPKQTRLEAVA